MRCTVHSEVDATGYCRNCGKAMCLQCTREVRGVRYCEECLAALLAKPQPLPGAGSPALAAILGFVPGLGAVYNGEYLKGLIHLVIFAGVIALLSSDQPTAVNVFLGVGLASFILYMPIEAHRTAKARRLGQQPPSFAGEAPGVSAPATPTEAATAAPAGTTGAVSASHPNWMLGPVILIGLGVLFLLTNLGWLALKHSGAVFLIALGIWLLWGRLRRTG